MAVPVCCVRGVGGVSRISPLPCSIPFPPWLPAPFLLVHALAALPLAAALGGLVLHTWWRVAPSVLLCTCFLPPLPSSF